MKPTYGNERLALYLGDAVTMLRELESSTVQCCITSPPFYQMRQYTDSREEIGNEPTLFDYISAIVDALGEVRRVLRDDGTLWIEIGDTYAGAGYSNHKRTGGARREAGGKQKHTHGTGLRAKNLCMIPHRLALALQDAGWYVRQDIVWSKVGALQTNAKDRPERSHSYIFLLSKQPRYFFSSKASRSVWELAVNRDPEHNATMPPGLALQCVQLGSRTGDLVLDPFCGSGSTGLAAKGMNRRFIGIDIATASIELSARRLGLQQAALAL